MMARAPLTNRVSLPVLSSPLHPRLGANGLVLTCTGRRSGPRCSAPVNYLQRGRGPLVRTERRWWQSLDDGAAAELRLWGRRVRATANVVGDPDVVAGALTAVVRDHPPYGGWAHVRAGADRTPDALGARVALNDDEVVGL